MVDIHSHILPGIDDGARTIDDTVLMLQMAADSGTTGIVATSHANTEYAWDAAVVEAKLAQVQSAIGDRLRVYHGCELHLTFDNVNDAIAHPNKYTINRKQWLLVEFSDLIVFQNSGEILARLRDAGMKPVVAHPERNQILQNRFETLEQWVSEGSYLQVTALSLLGTFGIAVRKFSERLIESGLVHFIATDAHDPFYRTPKLDSAFAWLESRYGLEYAQAVTTANPLATVQGLPGIAALTPAKKRKWFSVFG